MTLTSFPSFSIPPNPSVIGATFYGQVAMWNPNVFPSDPVKMSNGMEMVIGVANTPYGPSSGMTLFSQAPPVLGGSVSLMFSIQGFTP